MTEFHIDGTTDPFIRAELDMGESIAAERDSMASMSGTIDLAGKARGGMLKSLVRSATTGESFFMQEITATRGPGTVMLSPRHPGEVRVIELRDDSWLLADGAYLASDQSLDLKTIRNKSIGAAVFGGTGGFFMLAVEGTGTLCISGVGAVHELSIEPGEILVVDSGHAVAWPANLTMKASLSTGQGGGILGKVVGSAKSGEGVVLRFDGGETGGTILVSSRSRESYAAWMSELLPGD